MSPAERPPLKLQKSATYMVYGIIATIPILFGAVHPIVTGVYVFTFLVGCGGWLLLNAGPGSFAPRSFWEWVPIILIIYLALQTIPMPIEWVDLLSPARAERIRMVNELAGTDVRYIPISDHGTAGLFGCFFLFSTLLYFYCVKRLINHDPKVLRTIFIILILVGTFEAIYGLLQFVRPQLGILWVPLTMREAHGTISYKNQYASMLNMLWPLAIAGFALFYSGPVHDDRRKKPLFYTTKTQSVLYLAAAMTMILAVLFSLSRGGILTMVVVALLLAIMIPFERKRKLLVLALILSLVLGYVWMLGLDTLILRFDSLGQAGATRMAVYQLSIPIIFDHWLTGIGLGSYKYLSHIYLKGFPVGIHFFKAHSEYLELGIALGIPIFTLFMTWLLTGMGKMAQLALHSHGREQNQIQSKIVGIGALCGLIGFLLHGAIDFGWHLPVNFVYGVTLIAIILTCVRDKDDEKSVPNNGVAG